MTAADDLRPLLFGDVAIEAWPEGDAADGEPWASFVEARRHLDAGDQDLAVRAWARVSLFPGVESRHVAQAWRFLRATGVQPDPSIAARALGVVVEVPIDDGHDVLAAYEDGSVRYLNHAGGATVIEPGSAPTVTEAMGPVLTAGAVLAEVIGPWTEPERPSLPVGHLRISVLTPSGLRFGQGPQADLGADPQAGGVLAAATGLLVAVVDLGR